MSFYIIDDVFGDSRPGAQDGAPIFLPGPAAGQWDPVGGTCSECTAGAHFNIPIDPEKVQSGTWHTTTVSPDEPTTTISITFTGTWIAAYCLLPPDLGPGITSFMNLSFVLDGQNVGVFERTTQGDDWQYNSTVFSSKQLENKIHTFVVQPRADVDTSFVAFDYFQYQFDGDPPPSLPSSSSSSNTPTQQTTPVTGASNTAKVPTTSAGNTQSSMSGTSPSSTIGDVSSNSSSGSTFRSQTVDDQSNPTSMSTGSASPQSPTSNSVLSPGFSDSPQSPSPTNDASAANASVSSGHSAVIGGAVAGAVAALLLLLLLFWYLRRRSRYRAIEMSRSLEPPSEGVGSDALSMLTPYPLISPSRPAPKESALTQSRTEQSQSSSGASSVTKQRFTSDNVAAMQTALERMEDEVASHRPSEVDEAENQEVANMRQQMELMRAEIEELRNLRDEEPPPSYAPRSHTVSVIGDTYSDL